MLKETKVYIVSINNISFNIPVYNYIIPFLKKLSDNNINIIHSKITSIKDFSDLVNTFPILVFNNIISFYNQSILNKIVKYLRINNKLIGAILGNKLKIIYSPDFEVILLSVFYKIIFRNKKLVLVYHQFEMIEINNLHFSKRIFAKIFFKISYKIDLTLVPEINRAYYFSAQTGIEDDSIMLFPNTCRIPNNIEVTNISIDLVNKKNNNKIIAHIGALSSQNFFLREFLESLMKLDLQNLQLLFVGRITEEAKTIINSYSTLNTKIIDYIQHNELLKLYPSIDIGLILYKGVYLNLELAAPNKLYEYWSYGIPVIAPRLKGLVSLFKEDFLGNLVDFNDSKQLAGSINRIISNHPVIKYQIKNYFEKHLTIDNYLKMFKKKLEKKINLIQNV